MKACASASGGVIFIPETLVRKSEDSSCEVVSQQDASCNGL